MSRWTAARRCDNCKKVEPWGQNQKPTFTLTAVAMETGKGHRERRALRLVLGRFCEKCLRGREFRFKGDAFPKQAGQAQKD